LCVAAGRNEAPSPGRLKNIEIREMSNVRSICLSGIGAVVVIAFASAVRAESDGTAGVDAGALERALALLEEMDAIIVSVDYHGERIANVIEGLDAMSPIPIAADWEALRGMGVTEHDRVSLRLEQADLSTALAALAFQLGDEFGRPTIEIYEGRIILTTVGATMEMALLDVYDVRDLLRDSDVLEELRRERPAPEDAEPAPDADPVPAGGEGDIAADEDGEDADEDAPEAPELPGAPGATNPFKLPLPDFQKLEEAMPARPLTPGEELLALIAEHVDPEAWLEYGGSRARISERDGVLFVTAPPTTHRKFRDALRRLRQTNPSAVMIEAAIVDLPRDVFARLNRRYDAAGSALARAVLDAEEAVLLWQATSAVAMGDRLSAESEQKGVAVKLALTPRFDRETGILRIAIDVQSTAGDDRRSVTTTVTIPLRQGGSTIELPAAAAGESARLLVLIPQRM
jgi:hypothetical protein